MLIESLVILVLIVASLAAVIKLGAAADFSRRQRFDSQPKDTVGDFVEAFHGSTASLASTPGGSSATTESLARLTGRSLCAWLLASSLLCPASAASPAGCTFASDAAALQDLAEVHPFQVSYEGPYPHTTAGASVIAYLDDAGIVRVIHVTYLGETGRTEAVYELESRDSYRVGFERYAYDFPIYEDPRPVARLAVRACYVRRDGRVVEAHREVATAGETAAGPDNLDADLSEIVEHYLPLPTLPVEEPFPGADPRYRRYDELMVVGEALLAADRPAAALARFEEADAIDRFELQGFEPLLGIAEARCRMGDESGGRTALDDFRCALRVDAGELPCYIGEPTAGAPGEDNPELTRECRHRMCGEIFLGDYANHDSQRLAYIAELRRRAEAVADVCGSPRGTAGVR